MKHWKISHLKDSALKQEIWIFEWVDCRRSRRTLQVLLVSTIVVQITEAVVSPVFRQFRAEPNDLRPFEVAMDSN